MNCKNANSAAFALAWAALLALIPGCGERELFDASEEGLPVVDGILLVDRPFPPVFLRRARAADVLYDDASSALSGATLSIADGSLALTYSEDPLNAGKYLPGSSPPIVRAETEYTLDVLLPGGARLAARTTTPPQFDVTDWVILEETSLELRRDLRTYDELGDGVYDAPENQVTYLEGLLEARFTPPGGLGRYQVGISSLDEGSPFVIDGDFLDDEDFENFERHVGSPALEAADGFVRLPWFAIFFEGRHRVSVFSVDQNWFDLLRSEPHLTGAAGPAVGANAGDEFERPIFHVDGGIGLFGSASVDSIGFRILPRP